MKRFTVPLLVFLFVETAMAQAVSKKSVEAPTASLLSRSALIGFKSAIRNGERQGRVSQRDANCIQSIDETALIPTFRAAIRESWSQVDLEANDAFLRSELGIKFAIIKLSQGMAIVGERTPGPVPTLTDAETRQLEKFSQTESGSKLMIQKQFESEKSRQLVESGILSLAKSCGLSQ